jgi:hypothetical protein
MVLPNLICDNYVQYALEFVLYNNYLDTKKLVNFCGMSVLNLQSG